MPEFKFGDHVIVTRPFFSSASVGYVVDISNDNADDYIFLVRLYLSKTLHHYYESWFYKNELESAND